MLFKFVFVYLWPFFSDPLLPLSSLRLLVPPLRLLSAAMWQVAKQRDALHYDKVQEFVSLVTTTVPELLSHRQRAQLILGLRARVSGPNMVVMRWLMVRLRCNECWLL